jgi:electron transport complex protein RnfB
MEAIAEEDGSYRVQPDRCIGCIGCGVCTVTCPTEAISMVRKPDAEQDQPPADMKDWAARRTANRTRVAEASEE